MNIVRLRNIPEAENLTVFESKLVFLAKFMPFDSVWVREKYLTGLYCASLHKREHSCRQQVLYPSVTALRNAILNIRLYYFSAPKFCRSARVLEHFPSLLTSNGIVCTARIVGTEESSTEEISDNQRLYH